MAEPVPAGSDASAGTYRCTSCGNEIDVESTRQCRLAPQCGNGQWQTVSGGDSADDPYPRQVGTAKGSGGTELSARRPPLPCYWLRRR